MKRMRTIGLALLALLSLGVVTAASASAADVPQFSKATTFTVSGGASQLTDTVTGGVIECQALSSKGNGKVEVPKTVKDALVFTGCKAFGVSPCKSTSPKAKNAEEVITNTLVGTLGLVEETPEKKTGLHLQSVGRSEGTGEPFTVFECGGVKITVTESVVCELGPNHVLTTAYTLACRVNGKGVGATQQFTKLDGGTELTLLSKTAEEVAHSAVQQGEATLTMAKAIEIELNEK